MATVFTSSESHSTMTTAEKMRSLFNHQQRAAFDEEGTPTYRSVSIERIAS